MSTEGGPTTRERLVTAARALFTERGFAGTGTEAILEAADASRGSLYHHFRSKEAMLTELLSGFLDGLNARFTEIVETGVDPQADLDGLIAESFRTIHNERLAVALYQNERAFLATVEGFEFVAERSRENEALWIQVIEAGQASGGAQSGSGDGRAAAVVGPEGGVGEPGRRIGGALVGQREVVGRRLDAVVPVDVVAQVEGQQGGVGVHLPGTGERRRRPHLLVVRDHRGEEDVLLEFAGESCEAAWVSDRCRIAVADAVFSEVLDDTAGSVLTQVGLSDENRTLLEFVAEALAPLVESVRLSGRADSAVQRAAVEFAVRTYGLLGQLAQIADLVRPMVRCRRSTSGARPSISATSRRCSNSCAPRSARSAPPARA